MEWEDVLKIVVPILVSLLPPLLVMLIKWLKTQTWVQKAHLETIFETLIPQVVEWVEYWASELVKNGGTKPTSKEKMDKALSLLKEHIPETAKITEQTKLRLEVALQKLKNGDKS